LAGVNATSASVDTRAVNSDTITGCGSLVRAKLLEMWSEIRSVTVDAISQPLTVRRHAVNGPVSSLAIPGMSIQMPRNPTAAKTKEIAMIQRMVAGLCKRCGCRLSMSWVQRKQWTKALASELLPAETIARQRLLAIDAEHETSGRAAEVQQSMLPCASGC